MLVNRDFVYTRGELVRIDMYLCMVYIRHCDVFAYATYFALPSLTIIIFNQSPNSDEKKNKQ